MEQPRPDPPPPPAPSGGKSALAFFGVVLLLFLPGIVAQTALRAAGLLWTELFALLLPALVATAGSNLRVREYLKLRRPAGIAVPLGMLAGAAGALLASAVLMAVQRILPRSWLDVFDTSRLFEGPGWEQMAVAAVAVLVAPPCEELAFRGYLQSTLALRRRPAVAIVGAAALFAAIHLDPVHFLPLVVLGSVFGWLTWRAGSIWPAVAAHAANNALTSVLFLALGGPGAEVAPPPAFVILGTGGVGAAALALLLGAYRAVTPDPPPGAAALARADPADPSIGFSPTRVRSALRLATVAGIALLLAVLLGGALGAGGARRAVPPATDAGAPLPAERRGGDRGGAPPGGGS